MKNIKQQKNKDQGFVILFAMLISSIILLMTSGIFNVVQKQVILSSYARESQRAFYAADAALECALSYDIGPGREGTAFPVITGNEENQAPGSIRCGGSDLSVIDLGEIGEAQFFSFRYYNPSDEVGCAYILVKKTEEGGFYDTQITAAGFNSCIGEVIKAPNFDDPTLLERRLSITYQAQ